VLVHCLTWKGLGYKHAEDDTNDHFHGIGVIDPETGQPLAASGTSWTKVFDEMVALGGERDDVVAITAAMRIPVGLTRSRRRTQPEPSTWASPSSTQRRRQRGWRSADAPGGRRLRDLPQPGLRPVLMDVALHRCGVTFCLDRSA
jgi:1-deoxy-D-xylulose-5-phosphate synthase